MSLAEQVWFVVGIGGFLVFLEGAVGRFAREFKSNISEDWVKFIAGLVIFAIALVNLHFLPPAQ